jgi:hypothetical protein
MAGKTQSLDTMDKFDFQALAAILSEAGNLYRAKIADGMVNPQSNFVKVGPIPLDTAPLNPLKLPSPMRSIVLKDTTDETVRVSLVLGTDAKFAVDMAYPMDHNEVLNFPDPVPLAYLTWTAQPGKTATLYIGVNAEIKPGKIITVQSGTVGLSEGLAVTSMPSVSVGTAATQIIASDSNSRVVTIQNNGPGPIYVGDASVIVPTGAAGEKAGIALLPGATMDYRNAGALYGIVDAATVSAVVAVMKLQ